MSSFSKNYKKQTSKHREESLKIFFVTLQQHLHQHANLEPETREFISGFFDSHLQHYSNYSLVERILSKEILTLASNYNNGVEDEDYPEVDERINLDINRINNNRGKSKQAHFNSHDVAQEKERPSQGYIDNTKILPLASQKNEPYFFETIKAKLEPKSYELLMKLIHIYMNCIILPNLGILSYQELVSMAEPILVTLDKNLWPFFKEILETREGTRKKSSVFFASIKEKSDSRRTLIHRFSLQPQTQRKLLQVTASYSSYKEYD